jgi:hypothetical protein
MESRFIHPDCPCWHEYLEGVPHDFYHLPGYARICAEQERGEPLAFVAEDGEHRLFVPLIIRKIEHVAAVGRRLHDATNPYGYASPLWTGSDREGATTDFLPRAIGRLLTDLRRRGVVSLFLRLHPLLPLPLVPWQRFGMLIHHGETVFNDLTQSEEMLWKQTDRRCRKKIELARRHGCVAEIDDAWNCFEDFFETYTQTMSRVNAAPYYFFPRQYFFDLKEALHGALHLCVVRLRGTVASAGLFTEVSGIIQAHLVGSRPEYNKNEPTRLMMHYVRCWAKSRGNRLFHLGGGVGGKRDSLFQFKSGFSRQRGDFFTFRSIVNVEAYEVLVRAQGRNAAIDTVDSCDFFPVYRRSPRTITTGGNRY